MRLNDNMIYIRRRSLKKHLRYFNKNINDIYAIEYSVTFRDYNAFFNNGSIQNIDYRYITTNKA